MMVAETKSGTQTKSLRIASRVILGIAIAALLVPLWAVITMIPVFENMFMEANVNLPALTILFLSVPPTAYFMIFALIILGMIIKELIIRNNKVTLVLNGLAIVSVCFFMVLFLWTMYLPIQHSGG